MPVRPLPWQATHAGIALRGIARVDERLAARQRRRIDRWPVPCRERRPQLGEVLGHLAQVAVGQVRDEVVHRRVLRVPSRKATSWLYR